MLWIYQRGRDGVRIALTYDSVVDEFVIKTTGPDGTTLERITNAATFQFRLEALETAFDANVGIRSILDLGVEV